MQISDLTSSLLLPKAKVELPVEPTGPASATAQTTDGATQSRALDVLQQELRAALDLRFFTKSRQAPAGYESPATADGIQAETLGRARGLASATPGAAPSIVVRFRSTVSETASLLSASLANRPDVGAVNALARGLDERLAALGEDVANNRVASTEVLSVDRRTRASSNVRIRTQEGDVVRINITNSTRLSVDDASVSDDSGELSVTNLKFKEYNGLKISVKGDLNDEELAAIEKVFEQANEIATEFFDGDIAAALETSETFSFDTELIGNVSLRFRQFEGQQVAYARETVETPAPAIPESIVNRPDPTTSLPFGKLDALAPIINRPAPGTGATVVPELLEKADEVTTETPEVDDDQPAAPPVADAVPVEDPRERFLGLISDFLNSVREGFAGSEDGEQRTLFLSERFTLKLLSETIRVQTPIGAEPVGDQAADAIDELAAAQPDVEPISLED